MEQRRVDGHHCRRWPIYMGQECECVSCCGGCCNMYMSRTRQVTQVLTATIKVLAVHSGIGWP